MAARLWFQVALAALGTAVWVGTGCASEKIQVNPSLTTYGRKDLEKGELRLPTNTNTETFRRLLMGVAFNDISVKAGEISPNIVATLSVRLQTEMARLKRFTIFSAHNRGGVRMFQQLAEAGEANMAKAEEVDLKALDLVLSAAITVTKERQQRYDHDDLIYEVECDFSCEDLQTKTVVFAEKARGRAIRTQALSLAGKQLGGFSEEDERQAVYNAAMKALAVVANKLGNTYPVGGKVTGMLASGERFAFDKGFEDGIGKDQQVVLFADVGGVKVPLAAAEASAEKRQSSARVYRWNGGDADAKAVIKDIMANPAENWRKHALYAVGFGMPLPPEWENEYKD
jgi:hypothetical protein